MVKFNFGNLFGNVLHLARQQIAHDTPPNPDVIADFLSDLSNHFRRVPAEGGGNDASLEENNREASANSIRQADEGTANTIGNDADVATPRDISSTDLALSVTNDPNHEVSQHWTEGLAAAHSDTTTEAHNSSDIIDSAASGISLLSQVAGLLFPIPTSVINNSPSPKISNSSKEKESSSPAKSPKKGTPDNTPSSDKLKTYHKKDSLFFIK